jgi:hypothetical protein
LDGVSDPNPVRVVLEIEHEEGTISGRVAVAGVQASAFYGWLELIDQLERAVDGSATRSQTFAPPAGRSSPDR